MKLSREESSNIILLLVVPRICISCSRIRVLEFKFLPVFGKGSGGVPIENLYGNRAKLKERNSFQVVNQSAMFGVGLSGGF